MADLMKPLLDYVADRRATDPISQMSVLGGFRPRMAFHILWHELLRAW